MGISPYILLGKESKSQQQMPGNPHHMEDSPRCNIFIIHAQQRFATTAVEANGGDLNNESAATEPIFVLQKLLSEYISLEVTPSEGLSTDPPRPSA